MKYSSYDEFEYFVMGASIASGRVIWVGADADSNKIIGYASGNSLDSKKKAIISKDGTVVKIKRK